MRFSSWPKVTKKIRSTPKTVLFIKSIVFWKLYHASKNAGTVLRVTYIQTISQSKNQTPRLEIESKNVKKKVFSFKTLKQCHIIKICSGKRYNRYLSTVVYTTSWKTILNSFIPGENIAVYECCFRWAVSLQCWRAKLYINVCVKIVRPLRNRFALCF